MSGDPQSFADIFSRHYSYGCILEIVACVVKGNKASTSFDDIFNGP